MADNADIPSIWNEIPRHVMIVILSYLDLEDRYTVTSTCRYWRECFRLPDVWTNIHFRFILYYKTEGYMSALNMFGEYFINITITFNQDREEHIDNACAVLNHVSSLKNNRLRKLSIINMGNCLFNKQRVKCMFALRNFFSNESFIRVREVVLKDVAFGFDDDIVDHLSNNQNDSLTSFQMWDHVCKVSPESVVLLIKRCIKLTKLCICYCCVTEELILNLAHPGRSPLLFLGITCRADQPSMVPIASHAWKTLRQKYPNLRVSMKLEQAFSSERLLTIMDPEIPISKLWLMTNYKLSNDIVLLTEFYSNTLEEVVIVPSAFVDSRLGAALIKLSRSCINLKRLQVSGRTLRKETIEEIMSFCPRLKQKNDTNHFHLS